MRARGGLVTFGVRPQRAETGYGYIGIEDASRGLQSALSFVEKPDEVNAARYLAAGTYLWNSGMFVLGAQQYLDELKRYNPDMAMHTQAAMGQCTVGYGLFAPGA